MRVLGVDPGTSATGWAVLEAAVPRAHRIASGVLSLPSKLVIGERLRRIHQGVLHLLDEYKPEAVSLEKAFVKRNVQSAFRIGEARGAVLLAAAERETPVFEYAPAAVKQAVVGYGQADKRQMVRGIALLLAIEAPARFDEADALALAACHLQGARTASLLRRARS